MSNVTPYKKALLVKRAEIMSALEKEGYTHTDISFIFNGERSMATRILSYAKKSKQKIA